MAGIGLARHAFRDQSARDLALAAARAGWMGRLAREVGLFDALADICDHRQEVELMLYRAHHARAVATASPLALDLLAHFSLDADELVSMLRPGADWRRWICGIWPSKARGFARFAGVAPAPDDDDDVVVVVERDTFVHGGLIVREWSDPAGAVGIRLSPAGLEIGARLGPVHLRTIGDLATLTMGPFLPRTVRNAVVGLQVDAVFDHPVLFGRGYVISDQYERAPTSSDPREAWRVEFRAAPVPWSVPWARTRADAGGHPGRHLAPTTRTPNEGNMR